MFEQGNRETTWVLLFVADGFCEQSATDVLQQAQDSSGSVTTISLTTERIISLQGKSFSTHYRLDQIIELSARMNKVSFDGVLLAGGICSINHLLADPRLHHFLERLVDFEIPIGILRPFPTELVIRSPFYGLGNAYLQKVNETVSFLNQFFQQIAPQQLSSEDVGQCEITSPTATSGVVE